MKTNFKLLLTLLTLSLAFVSQHLPAATCPSIDSIKRVSGEYQWVTTEPGWTGYFIAPTTGRGRSYVVKMFLNATWVKAYDTIDSAGFIQCDYIGDFGYKKNQTATNQTTAVTPAATNPGGTPATNQVVISPDKTSEYEIIRFTQTKSNGALPPDAKFSWNCKSVTTFPSEACTCYGNVDKCNFRMS